MVSSLLPGANIQKRLKSEREFLVWKGMVAIVISEIQRGRDLSVKTGLTHGIRFVVALAVLKLYAGIIMQSYKV